MMQRVLHGSGSLARAVLGRPTAVLALGAGVQQIARQFAVASSSRKASVPPPGVAAEGERKGIRVGFFSAHNYEIGALRTFANQEGVTPDSELLCVAAHSCWAALLSMDD
jgi:hypothetical protein